MSIAALSPSVIISTRPRLVRSTSVSARAAASAPPVTTAAAAMRQEQRRRRRRVALGSLMLSPSDLDAGSAGEPLLREFHQEPRQPRRRLVAAGARRAAVPVDGFRGIADDAARADALQEQRVVAFAQPPRGGGVSRLGGALEEMAGGERVPGPPPPPPPAPPRPPAPPPRAARAARRGAGRARPPPRAR